MWGQAVKGLVGITMCADSHARMISVRGSLGQGVLLLFAMCSSWFSSSKIVADVTGLCTCNNCHLSPCYRAHLAVNPQLRGTKESQADEITRLKSDIVQLVFV